jgi:hypothetical protein
MVNPDGDRWSSWHAVEFKDGSFSFPGVARMLGMQPPPTSNAHASYDPFDLAASHTRPRSTTADHAAAREGAPMIDPLAAADNADATQALAAHKTRGWRDPRLLREQRAQGLAARQDGREFDTGMEPAQGGSRSLAMLRNLVEGSGEDAVGTGVITASATAGMEASGEVSGLPADDAQWYGIVQAPNAATYAPLELQQADIGEVQVQLSEMVSGPEHTWNLAPLADRTRYLIEHGVTAIERGEARLLLDRIEAFADVARRSTELGMSPPVALPASVNASISASPIAAAATRWASPLGLSSAVTESSSGSAPRFDATGWVVPVHSSNRDMPTHALTNDAGKIIVYLSAAAGVNLPRYQGQAVGVYGLRGYLPQLKANHIQVQRAVRLH